MPVPVRSQAMTRRREARLFFDNRRRCHQFGVEASGSAGVEADWAGEGAAGGLTSDFFGCRTEKKIPAMTTTEHRTATTILLDTLIHPAAPAR